MNGYAILTAVLWVLIVAAVLGVMIAGFALAYDRVRYPPCSCDDRSVLLLLGCTLLGGLVGTVQAVIA